MWTFYKYEWKNGQKSMWIWSLLIGGLGFVCLLMYNSMETSMMDMAESFSSMGAFSDAFGMSTLSIATATGFFATEIGTIHGLGSGMFAAFIATNLLSKEEENHTADFTFALPVSRGQIWASKLLYLLSNLVMLTLICACFYVGGFLALQEKVPYKGLCYFMGGQLFMNMVIAVICFAISAFVRKSKLGIGIGIALMFYLFDLMSRVIPDLEDFKFLSPYSFCNASEIFSEKAASAEAVIFGAIVFVLALFVSRTVYCRKDLL